MDRPRESSDGERGRLVGFPRGAELPPQNNLPLQLTSFVGREREVADLEELLAGETRLLTLTGAGGSGKTRLALAVSSRVTERFEDGVWWVELAPISEPELVPQAVARALMVTEEPDRPLVETLARDLASTEMLLVLDNCEHLIGACSYLADTLLRSCPDLKILATSRETLGIARERPWLVPVLSLPDPDHPPTLERLASYGAVSLFVERGQAATSAFELTESNAATVARLCCRLDGMPLAIELAAARMRVLSVEQITKRLEDPLGLLSSGSRIMDTRHRTLRATLEWSHELLDQTERTVLRRLSVFAEGWDLEAAEAVCSGDGIEAVEVLDLLSGLVDKSLVVSVPGAEGVLRYGMLEPVRQFATEKLEESGEAEGVRERHARYYLALAEEAELDLKEQGAWLDRLGPEHANFRGALSWTFEPDDDEERAQLGLRLAAALAKGRFWAAHGLNEGIGWLEKGLQRSSAAPRSVRAKALDEGGYLMIWRGDYEKGVALLEESYTISREIGDNLRIVGALFQLGNALLQLEGDDERLESLRQEAEALRQEPLDPPQAAAPLLLFLGFLWLDRGDKARMVEYLEEALVLFRQLGDLRGIGMCLTVMSQVALDEGDLERAAPMVNEAMHVLRELKDKMGTFYTFLGLAVIAGSRGMRSVRRGCGARPRPCAKPPASSCRPGPARTSPTSATWPTPARS